MISNHHQQDFADRVKEVIANFALLDEFFADGAVNLNHLPYLFVI